MRVSLVVRPPVGVRRKPLTIELHNGAPLTLDELKELWNVERALNNLGTIRVELVVEEGSVSRG